MTIQATKRVAIVNKGLRYQKKTQVRSSGGGWIPKYDMAAASRETAFRHVRSKRGDRRLGIFQFRITRDDGTVIDIDTLYKGDPVPSWVGIGIYQKKDAFPNPTSIAHLQLVGSAIGKKSEDAGYWDKVGDNWYYRNASNPSEIIEFSYNTKSQIWTVPLFSWELNPKTKEKKFWVFFSCEDSIFLTEYVVPTNSNPEYAYKNEDKYKEKDFLKPKFYKVAVPYWEVVYENNAPNYIFTNFYTFEGSCDEFVDFVADNPDTKEHGAWHTTQKSFYKKAIVKSSVPLEVQEHISHFDIDTFRSAGHNSGGWYVFRDCPNTECSWPTYGTTLHVHSDHIDREYVTGDHDIFNVFYSVPIEVGVYTELEIVLTADLDSSPSLNVHQWCYTEDSVYHEMWVDYDWITFVMRDVEPNNFISVTVGY